MKIAISLKFSLPENSLPATYKRRTTHVHTWSLVYVSGEQIFLSALVMGQPTKPTSYGHGVLRLFPYAPIIL